MIRNFIATVIGLLLSSSIPSYAFRAPMHQHVMKTLPFDADATAPLLSASNAEIIPNSYIVVLKEDAELNEHLLWFNTLLTAQLTRGNEVNTLKHVYSISDGLMKGYSGIFDEKIIDEIRISPEVEFVERDQIVKAIDVEHNAPWGLARISHHWNSSSVAKEKFDYLYDHAAGANVTAYIVDTGVNIMHDDFRDMESVNKGKRNATSRAVWGATIPEGDRDVDGNGHGTHVAGTVGGLKYGAAKKVKIVAVKVLRSSGTGSLSDVIKGIEWTVKAHKNAVAEAEMQDDHDSDLENGDDKDFESRGEAGKFPFPGKPKNPKKPKKPKVPKHPKTKVRSVANMSLGGGRSRALDQAVDKAVEGGVLFSVAAGNDGKDACNYSPAASKNSITAGATASNDYLAYFSNHGSCVDVFAPGKDIQSAWIGSNKATNTISGTSMAAPHVCGVAALLLSQAKYAQMSPRELKDAIIKLSTPNVIQGLPTWTQSKNRLLYNDPPSSVVA